MLRSGHARDTDTLDAFRARFGTEGTPGYFAGDPHWTAAGHALAAELADDGTRSGRPTGASNRCIEWPARALPAQGGLVMTVAIVCSALLGLLVFGLGLLVSLQRVSTDRAIGYEPDPKGRLHKLVRAHANAAEYGPMMAVLMLLVGSHDPASWMVWTFVVATACRYLHAAGRITCATLARPNPLRFMGATGTYLTGLTLVVATLLRL